MNTEDFIKRLEFILEYYGLSASSFSDTIHVQRSSISHLLSGRNKPSLDFILKVIHHFPEIDLLWFLNGVGVFPKNSIPKATHTVSHEGNDNTKQIDLFDDYTQTEKNQLFENKLKEEAKMSILDKQGTTNVIEKIIVFYTDGTFKSYTEKN